MVSLSLCLCETVLQWVPLLFFFLLLVFPLEQWFPPLYALLWFHFVVVCCCHCCCCLLCFIPFLLHRPSSFTVAETFFPTFLRFTVFRCLKLKGTHSHTKTLYNSDFDIIFMWESLQLCENRADGPTSVSKHLGSSIVLLSHARVSHTTQPSIRSSVGPGERHPQL